MLAIAGQSFGEVAEGLSPAATANLNAATAFPQDWLTAPPADSPAP